MNDDVKKALEELTQTFAIVHRVATHQTDDAYMSIPANPKRDADLRHAAAVEALRAHIDAEPERLAAAVAREREEQREADVRSCPTCKGEGFTMRVRECPFCNDSTHDHECPTDEVKVYCACGAAHIRATPLTATPLADRIAKLEGEVAAWAEKAAATMHESLRAETLKANLNLAAERDAAQERVRELEDIACALAFDTGVARELAARSSRDMYAKAWEREIGPPYRAKTHHIDAMVLTTRDRMDEIKHLKAQLAEAMGVLRYLVEFIAAGGTPDDEDLAKARAFLAKYPEGR